MKKTTLFIILLFPGIIFSMGGGASGAAAQSAAPNYYQILGVTRNATLQEIEEKYKELRQGMDPRRGKASKIMQNFQIIHQAYIVLSNPSRRAEYDSSLTSPALISPAPVPTPIPFALQTMEPSIPLIHQKVSNLFSNPSIDSIQRVSQEITQMIKEGTSPNEADVYGETVLMRFMTYLLMYLDGQNFDPLIFAKYLRLLQTLVVAGAQNPFGQDHGDILMEMKESIKRKPKKKKYAEQIEAVFSS